MKVIVLDITQLKEGNVYDFPENTIVRRMYYHPSDLGKLVLHTTDWKKKKRKP